MPWLLAMTLAAAFLMLLIHFFIGKAMFKMVLNRQQHRWIYRFFFLLLFSFYIFPLWGFFSWLLSGDADMLTFASSLTYWFWFGFVVSFQWISLLIILTILRWLARRFTSVSALLRNKWYARTSWILGALLFIYTGGKMIHDTRSIYVQKMEYASAKVPSILNNLRIVHVSDIHGDEFTGPQRIARYIDKVNTLHPDIVVFTGDLVSYGTNYISMAAGELAKANPKYGIYAVIGDHDYWAGAARVASALRKRGIHVLRDKNSFIPIGRDSLLLTGLTEVYSKHVPQDTLRLLTQQHSPKRFKIMASHQPTEKVIHQAEKKQYQLLLAGHTHGGQLRVPFMFMHFSAAELDTPYLSGSFRFGDMLMNVNNGLGFTLAPVRYDAAPDISVIDLKSTKTNS